MKMISNLFDHSFQITGCHALLNFAKTMFSSLQQYHEEMQNTYGMDHIIVRTVIQTAKKFGTTMKELSEWGSLERNDFHLRNWKQGRRLQCSFQHGMISENDSIGHLYRID
jgi:hypothetical protein